MSCLKKSLFNIESSGALILGMISGAALASIFFSLKEKNFTMIIPYSGDRVKYGDNKFTLPPSKFYGVDTYEPEASPFFHNGEAAKRPKFYARSIQKTLFSLPKSAKKEQPPT